MLMMAALASCGERINRSCGSGRLRSCGFGTYRGRNNWEMKPSHWLIHKCAVDLLFSVCVSRASSYRFY